MSFISFSNSVPSCVFIIACKSWSALSIWSFRFSILGFSFVLKSCKSLLTSFILSAVSLSPNTTASFCFVVSSDIWLSILFLREDNIPCLVFFKSLSLCFSIDFICSFFTSSVKVLSLFISSIKSCASLAIFISFLPATSSLTSFPNSVFLLFFNANLFTSFVLSDISFVIFFLFLVPYFPQGVAAGLGYIALSGRLRFPSIFIIGYSSLVIFLFSYSLFLISYSLFLIGY